ncbi:type II TA system antitoxin MqsA family protein [Massilia sp. BJB1822]|uniref:type II TA system antitoxin MqsA family protein n=1 Tax=Massilia sp. BJB1822 TaxID=2744470 RepID=UPI0015946058|nr:type II TA system antitoxin MqsA family protein [Massilia sp. BJB1822]NVD99946.1 type II toxin-antitoxin system MqsA family antitoxin [Massilia sp. BJB1822]
MKNCPGCGAPSPAHATRDMPYTYKGQNTIIPAVRGYHCASCGEVTLDHDAVDRFSELLGEFQRKVNSELVDPAYILTVRRKLRLDQREAGEIFGGGANAFSRYETGKARPHISTIKLLKLLDRHPELLDEVRQ